MDEQFIRWHLQQVADHARHKHGKFRPKGVKRFLSPFTRPVQDIVAGVLFGAKGLFIEPYKGLKGNIGLGKGIGIGVVGLVAKPLVGIFDAFAHVFESVESVARSANILETKFNSVKKVHFRYIFGANDILIPYKPVDACSANLLRLHPFENGKSANFNIGITSDGSSKEILVLSEMLQFKAGEAVYAIVTTKRIVSFRVRTDGSAPPALEWQVDLKRDTIIKVSILTGGHNGVFLCIKHSNQKLNSKQDVDVMEQESQTMHESHPPPNMISEDMNSIGLIEPNECSSQDSDKLYHSKSVSSPPSLAPKASYQQDHDSFDVKKIEGEFQHRSELTRIHNAICCLTGQFESVESEKGIGTDGNTEGFTSFGYLNFDENLSTAATPKDEEKHFYNCLERVPWVQGSRPNAVSDRNIWSFSDELEVSKKEGGPQWVISSRAQAMFVPMPFPSLQCSLRHDDERVQKLSKDLANGKISLDQAKKEFEVYTNMIPLNHIVQKPILENQRQLESEFPSLVSRIPFRRHSLSRDSQDMGLNHACASDENVGPTLSHRLSLVENLLKQLIAQNNSPLMHSGDNLLQNQQFIPNQRVNQRVNQAIEQNDQVIYSESRLPQRESYDRNSCSSMISALSSGGNNGMLDHTNIHQPSEIEILRTEVKMLKIELDTQRSIPGLKEEHITTTDELIEKKKKKKMNIKKVWKKD